MKIADCMKKWSVRALVTFLLLLPAFAHAGTTTRTFTNPATTNWTAPTGITSATVEAWGGGGGGGGTNAGGAKGGGGAGGQYARKVLTVVPGNSYAVVVGAGGTVSSGNSGGTGGDSTFAGSSVVAKGGAFGTRGTSSTALGAAGVGSTASGVGDTVYAGGNGSIGSTSNPRYGGAGGGGAGSGGNGGNASGSAAGNGTATGGGTGGAGQTSSNTSGNPGSAAGGGGGGGYESSFVGSNTSGGAGGSGRVSITWTDVAPIVTNAAASSITAGTATLNGSVGANSADATVKFYYGVGTPNVPLSAGTVSATTSSTPTMVGVSATVSGLTCNTTYTYFVEAGNNGGTTDGSPALQFTTKSCPSVTTGAATSVTTSSATLSGNASSNGTDATTLIFDYGTDASYGLTVTPSPSSLSATGASAVSASLSNLACGTTYHYRLRGSNSGGTAVGNDATFTTLTCPVQLAKTGATSGLVGNYASFVITAINPNANSPLTGVTIVDDIPASLQYSSHAASLGVASLSGTKLTWTIAYLPPNTTATLTLVVKLMTKGQTVNTVTSAGATSASSAIYVLPGGVVHYRMDETQNSWNGTTGEVLDYGSKHLNGTRTIVSGSSTSTNARSLPDSSFSPTVPTIATQYSSVVGGDFCNAGKFDGKAVVKTPSDPFFQFSTALSASAWIYPTCYPNADTSKCYTTTTSLGAGANSYLYSILSNDSNYEFHINSDGKLYWWWQFPPNDAYILNSATAIPLNQWTHVAITFDSVNNRQRIYINGVLDAQRTLPTAEVGASLKTNPCPMYVGGDISTVYPQTNPVSCPLMTERTFHGMIDETKIYEYELAPEEVVADMTQGRLCSGTYDHIQIEYGGSASICKSKTVTVKACMDSGCTGFYPGTVTLTLSPAGWSPSGDLTISGGMAQATLSNSAISGTSIALGATNISPTPNSALVCVNTSNSTKSCTMAVDSTACTSIMDAVETTNPKANPGTNLYTKLAGTQFNADLVALVNAGSTTVDSNYIGTVTYDVVDTSTAACPSGTSLSSAQTVDFTASDLGRKTVQITCCGTAAPYKIAKSAKVRMKLGATSTYACSSDAFAVRPPSLALTAPSATAAAPSATATPTVKAGAPFTLTATNTTPGYGGGTNPGGTLVLVSSRLTYQDPTVDPSGVLPTCPGAGCKGALGTLATTTLADDGTPELLVNSSATNNASYSEVGYVSLAEGAFIDTDASLTQVDRAVGDCIVGSATTTLTSGKYGCDVGTSAIILGRFVPDHFGTSLTLPMACPGSPAVCPSSASSLSGMAYSGQPFTSKITAYAAGGGTTKNYMNYFAKATALKTWDGKGSTTTDLTSAGATSPGTLSTSAADGSDLANTVPAGYFVSGATSSTSATTPTQVYAFSAATPTTPTGVFLRATDTDNVTSLAATNPTTDSVEGGAAIVKGRLRLSSNSGSANMPLKLFVQPQYWDGSAWLPSTTDLATGAALNTGAVALSNYLPKGTPGLSSSNIGARSFVQIGSSSVYQLVFAAPGAAGSVDVAINLGSSSTDQSCLGGTRPTTTGLNLPWLRSQNGTCDASTAGTADPSARATFGIYRTNVIHSRDLY